MGRPELKLFSRRNFLSSASVLAGSSLLFPSRSALADPPPEVTKIRLVHAPAICLAPQYLAEELLYMEGFSTVEYVDMHPGIGWGPGALAADLADFTMWDSPSLVVRMDQGKRFTVLSGIHAGCYELFVNDRVRSVPDLKGKSVAVSDSEEGSDYVFLSSVMSYVGLDPRKDVRWITPPTNQNAFQIFADGKADAFIGFAPEPQKLRALKVGRVILDSAQDQPWSRYFCCMLAANEKFVSKYPVATKRALRSILKAADMCAQDPQRAANYLVKKGYEPRYEIGLEVLKSLPYARWREANPEDSLRFHALRLREVGLIKSTPQKIIAQGTDWRFLNELKRELKA